MGSSFSSKVYFIHMTKEGNADEINLFKEKEIKDVTLSDIEKLYQTEKYINNELYTINLYCIDGKEQDLEDKKLKIKIYNLYTNSTKKYFFELPNEKVNFIFDFEKNRVKNEWGRCFKPWNSARKNYFDGCCFHYENYEDDDDRNYDEKLSKFEQFEIYFNFIKKSFKYQKDEYNDRIRHLLRSFFKLNDNYLNKIQFETYLKVFNLFDVTDRNTFFITSFLVYFYPEKTTKVEIINKDKYNDKINSLLNAEEKILLGFFGKLFKNNYYSFILFYYYCCNDETNTKKILFKKDNKDSYIGEEIISYCQSNYLFHNFLKNIYDKNKYSYRNEEYSNIYCHHSAEIKNSYDAYQKSKF